MEGIGKDRVEGLGVDWIPKHYIRIRILNKICLKKENAYFNRARLDH